MGLGIKIPKNVFAKSKKAFEENPGNETDLPPGKYVVTCKSLEGIKGHPLVKLTMQVSDGEMRGATFAKLYGTEDDKLQWLLRDLDRLGYSVDGPDDLDEVADDIKESKPIISVTAKENGEYVNYFVNNVISGKADEETEEETEEAEDEIEEEEEWEDEEEAEEEEGDQLDDMTRDELKKFIKENKLGIRVGAKMSDDDIRNKIREATAPEEEEEEEEEEPEGDDDDSVELEVGMEIIAKIRGKEGVLAKVTQIDEENERIKVLPKGSKKSVFISVEDVEEIPF